MARRLIWVQPLTLEQRDRAKRSFATRRVPEEAMRTLIGGSVRPRSGDVVLARIHRLSNHRHVEQFDGRRAKLHTEDTVILSYADRYATDQFESEVPADLGRTQLVASGGIASGVVSRSMDVRSATDIVPIGLIGDDRGRPLNLASFGLTPVTSLGSRPRTVAVFGTSMNSGKTTTLHYLVHSLSRAGYRPGATKVTGTGSGNDYWVMMDAGAHHMLDFTDVGLASTYKQSIALLERKFTELIDHLTDSGAGVNLVEIADGLLQLETAQLIESETFRSTIDAVLFAANDAMGAAMGVSHLRDRGYDVVAVSGRLTRSPLAVREAQLATGLPILGIAELGDLAVVSGLLGLDPPLENDRFVEPQVAWPVPTPVAEFTGRKNDQTPSDNLSDERFVRSDQLADMDAAQT